MEEKLTYTLVLDRTNSEMENFRKLRIVLREKKNAEAESINLNIRYMIKQNTTVENTEKLFRFNTKNLLVY